MRSQYVFLRYVILVVMIYVAMASDPNNSKHRSKSFFGQKPGDAPKFNLRPSSPWSDDINPSRLHSAIGQSNQFVGAGNQSNNFVNNIGHSRPPTSNSAHRTSSRSTAQRKPSQSKLKVDDRRNHGFDDDPLYPYQLYRTPSDSGSSSQYGSKSEQSENPSRSTKKSKHTTDDLSSLLEPLLRPPSAEARKLQTIQGNYKYDEIDRSPYNEAAKKKIFPYDQFDERYDSSQKKLWSNRYDDTTFKTEHKIPRKPLKTEANPVVKEEKAQQNLTSTTSQFDGGYRNWNRTQSKSPTEAQNNKSSSIFKKHRSNSKPMATLGHQLKEFDKGKYSKEHLTAELVDENMYHWTASFRAPETTPLAGRTIKVDISELESFPMKPPKVKFISNIYHPNVKENGEICADFLKDEWKQYYTIYDLLHLLVGLYANPNPDDGVNEDAIKMFNRKTNDYKTMARMIYESGLEFYEYKPWQD